MALLRAFVFLATLAVAFAPFAAFAADDSQEHLQAELANGFAQLQGAQDQAMSIQADANASAQNERMIAILKSESMRERQLNNSANANALDEIAHTLADAARNQGMADSRNSLAIANNQITALLANVDGNLANAQMMAQTRGRWDEWFNAKAQADQLQQIGDFIATELVQRNMANDMAIGAQRAAVAEADGTAEVAASQGMAAAELLAADTVLQAGTLAGISSEIDGQNEAADLIGHATVSLENAEAQLANGR